MLGGGFRKKRLPGKALVLIAGQNHAHTGGLALGDDFDVDVIIHVFFLSQPFSGGVQKQHSAGCFIGQNEQLRLPGCQIAVQPLPVVVDQQNFPNLRQTESHFFQGVDAVDRRQLFFAVIAVAGECVHFAGGQQADLVIVAQHPNADSG